MSLITQVNNGQVARSSVEVEGELDTFCFSFWLLAFSNIT